YAPKTSVRLCQGPDDFRPEPGKRYALLSYRGQEKDGFLDLCDWEEIAILSPGSGRVAEAGIRFFHVMRQLDQLGVNEIVAEPMPDRGVGKALLDKLRKASAD
ncbi:MAG: Sua5 family C-terminal domain-containing protein, partial [Verrucomicrobiota bacterium]